MEELKTLGLNNYEITVYTTLLKLGSATAFMISKWSGVPFGRIYDVLESLSSKGLVALESQKPKKFRVIAPETALGALLARKRKEWTTQQEKIARTIKSLSTKKRVEEPISIFKGRLTYYGKLQEYFTNARKEVFTIAGGLTGELHGIPLLKTTRELKKRGIKQKLILPVTKENIKTVRKIVKLHEVRHYSGLAGLRLTIVDGNRCLIGARDPSLLYEHITMEVKSKPFAAAMRELHKALWEKAVPAEKVLSRQH